MNLQFNWEERSWKATKFILAFIVLVICLFFIFYSNYKSAISGISVTTDLEVIGISSCSADEVACNFNAGKLELGDHLLAIGDISSDEVASDRRIAPFAKANPGDIVPVTVDRAGEVRSFEIKMVEPNILNIIILLVTYLLIIGPFWLVGFFLSLYLVPNDSRWRLQVAFYYLTALWVAIGLHASWKYAYSSLIMHALSWILVPVFIHFHLVTPAPLLQKSRRIILTPLYVLAVILAMLELFQRLPDNAYLIGFITAVACSITILLYRAISKRQPAERITARIMVSGVLIAFGPGILLWVLPALVGAEAPDKFATTIVILAMPILPLFYGYGVYKRWLGQNEKRLNRFLSRYALFTLYLIIFSIGALVGSSRQVDLSSPDLLYSIIILSAFLIAALPLNDLAEKFMSRLAYGYYYRKAEIVQSYASRILESSSTRNLAKLIDEDLCRTLSIHQSALIAINDQGMVPIYKRGVDSQSLQIPEIEIQSMVEAASIYLKPDGNEYPEIQGRYQWLRLVIPLVGRKKLVGLWLLGGRNPDDYYTQTDIELLSDLSHQMATTVENRQLFSALEKQLYERREAERQTALYAERLTLLHQLDQAMLAEGTPEEIAHAALRKLVDIVSCTRASVINVDGTRVSLLALHDTRKIDDPTDVPDLMPKISSTLNNGTIWILEDSADLDPDLPLYSYLQSLELATILSAPMKLDGQLLGSLSIAYEKPTEINQELRDIAQEIANSLVLAVQNARLRDTITRHSHDLKQLSLRLITVQENERKRISYELHDEIGQILTAIKFDLVAIEQEANRLGDSTINNRLSDAKELVEGLMEQVRSMSLELRPSMLQDLGLAPTLRWYASTYAERREMDVQFEISDFNQRFKEEVEISLYRVYQEALSNVSRHAQASSIKLYLNQHDQKIVGFIQDDGQGFDVKKIGERKPIEIGIGLIAMRERIASLKGVFELRSEIGKGTCVRFEVPLGEAA